MCDARGDDHREKESRECREIVCMLDANNRGLILTDNSEQRKIFCGQVAKNRGGRSLEHG